MDKEQLSPAQLAERLDINRSNLTHLFSGRNQPSLDLAKKILHAFPEISTEWLIMGVGSMKRIDTGGNKPLKQPDNSGELDLFSSVLEIKNPKVGELETAMREKKNIISTTSRESNNPIADMDSNKKNDSHKVKIVEKIVFFYNDKSFTIYEV